MKKLFISQPMKGISDKEIITEREKAIKTVKEILGEEVEVIDSFFQNAPHDAKPLWFLGKSIELLSTADVAYFVSGWEYYRGCKIEYKCAIEYGIVIIEQDGSEYQRENMDKFIFGKNLSPMWFNNLARTNKVKWCKENGLIKGCSYVNREGEFTTKLVGDIIKWKEFFLTEEEMLSYCKGGENDEH